MAMGEVLLVVIGGRTRLGMESRSEHLPVGVDRKPPSIRVSKLAMIFKAAAFRVMADWIQPAQGFIQKGTP